MDQGHAVINEFVERLNVAALGGTADPYSLLHDDIVVDVFGTTPISGVYRGLNQVRGILASTIVERFNRARVRIQELIGSGDRIAGLVVIYGISATGAAYNEKKDPDGFVFRLRRGKIIEIRAYPDTTLIEMALFDNVYTPSKRLN